jgi:hypothetical protein
MRARTVPRVVPPAVAALVAGAALAGCGGEKVEGPPPAAPERIGLESPAFQNGGALPARFGCDGDGISPPLRWASVPKRARELALLVEDPDAPGGTFVHWSVFGLPASVRSFPEGAAPGNALEGENSFGDGGYGAPCPPRDDPPQRYVFSLYALERELELEAGAKPVRVREAVADAALVRGTLIARYGR